MKEKLTEKLLLRLSDFVEKESPKVSFEFFPPKTDKMEEQLWESIKTLESLQPNFVSVTYGAGGSTRQRTHSTVKRIIDETSLKPAAHFTCVGASKAEIDEILRDYWDIGVRHLVALRGDPQDGSGKYEPHPEGYAYANDLVAGIKKIADFEISVAAYPEIHPEAVSADKDLEYLKKKIDAGADRAITQYFFDVDKYLNFLERAKKIGISVPIVPGILPITNFKQSVSFSKKCGVEIPDWIHKLFNDIDDNPMTRKLVAMVVVVEQCNMLRSAGIDEFHFYTLNRAELSAAICHLLGISIK
jgi:methylenetetrahydrofolate reductase (NADPH)